jgi:flavin-dependent dehydrogenase
MIPATLTPSTAAGVHWDAIIVGAGPAGSATAIRLSRDGQRVLLLDRGMMPRPKVCGCCLSPQAMAELESLVGRSASDPHPVPLRLVRIFARGGLAQIAMQGGGTLSREALDPLLVRRAIDAGAEWLPQCSVRDCEDDSNEVRVRVQSNGAPATGVSATLRGDLCILATGLADHVRIRSRATPTGQPQPRRRQLPASRIGLGATLAPEAGSLPGGELVMAVGRSGYVGLVRLEDGRIDVAAAIDATAIAAAGSSALALADLVSDACSAAPDLVLRHSLLAAEVRATRPLTHVSPLVAGDGSGIFRVGDAAGYIEPFTGEGMGWALTSARILANALIGGRSDGRPIGRGNGHVAGKYRDDYADAFAVHHARCRAIARAVRHPLLVAGAVRAAALSPRIAARLLPWVVGGRPVGSVAARSGAER